MERTRIAIDREHIETLVSLGLNGRQAKIYLALLQIGTASVSKISSASGVPRPDSYRALEQLKSLGLIQKGLSIPTKYKAFPLDFAISILIGRREAQNIQLQRKAERLLKDYAEKRIEENGPEANFILLSNGETFLHQLEKTLQSCQNEICLIASRRAFARFLTLYSDYFIQVEKNRVSFKIITEKSFDDAQFKRLLNAQKIDNLEIRHSENYPLISFAIFDKKEIMLLTEDQAINGKGEVVWSNHASLLQLAQNFFNDAWFSATEPPEKEFKRNRLQFDHLFDNMPASFAYCRILLNKERKPVDFIILQVNEAFKAIDGLDRLHVANKKATELFPGAFESNQAVFNFLSRVACAGSREHFEVFFKPLNLWLSGTAYSPKGGYFAVLFWDITKRKEAEEKVQEEQRKAVNYLNVVGSIVLALDLQGRITLLNKKGYEVLGYKEGELQGKDWVEIALPPECREELTNVFSEWINGTIDIPKTHENSIVTKNGERRLISWHNTMLKDASGNLIGTLSAGEDITEHKKAEDALTRSEQRFRIMADGSPIIIWIANTKGETVFVNRTYKEFFGITDVKAGGDNWKPLVYRDDAPSYVGNYLQALKEQKAFVAQARVRRYDGAWRWVETHGEAYFSSNNEFLGHIGVTIDITERKEAEQALILYEEKHREIINSMNDAAWVIGLDSKFIDVNYAAEKLLGYTKNELLSMRVFDIDKKIDAKSVTELHQEALAKGYKVFETTLTAKNGRQVPVEISLSKVAYRGKSAILSIVRDITERKKVQEALKQSEEKYRSLFENSFDAIMLTEPNGGILAANPQACKMLRMTEEEIKSAGRKGIVVADQRLETTLKERESVGHARANLTLRRKDGTMFIAEVSFGTFKDRDGIVKTSMIIKESN